MARSGPGDINPYESSITPGGAVDARTATAADFGGDGGYGGLARGLGSAAGSLDDIGTRQQAIQADQARIWASTASAQTELGVRQQFDAHVNSLDPTSKDYPAQINSLTDDADSMWQDAATKLEQSAPDPMAQRMVARQLQMARQRYVGDTIGQQAKLNADYTGNLLQGDLKAKSDLLAAAPDNDTYNRVVAQTTDAITGTTSFGPDVKQKYLNAATHQLAVVQVQSLVSRDPAGFLKAVNAQGGVTDAHGTKGEIPTVPGSAPTGADPFLSKLPTETQAYVPGVMGKLGSARALNADGTASPDLVKAVIGQESGGNAAAVSGKGAQGLMQVMPATAASIGYAGLDLKDPAVNVAVGTAYLNTLLKKYNGDVPKTLAAYNAGPGAADAAIASAEEPQVQPLTDAQVADAKPPIAGWDKLAWDEKMQYVRSAEGLLGKNLASQRGDMTQALQDATVALRNGQTPPGLSSGKFSLPNLTAIYGPTEGARRYAGIQYDAGVSNFMQRVGTMPAAQRQQWLATNKPEAGPGDAETFPAYAQAQEAVARVVKQQQSNPIAYAMQTGIGNAQPLDFSAPDKLAASLASRQTVMQTMTHDYGTKPQIFTDAEVQQIGSKLGTMGANDRIAFLAGMRSSLTNDTAWHTAMAQIAPKNPGLAYAAQIAIHAGNAPSGEPAMEVAAKVAQGDIILNGYAAPAPGSKPGAGQDVDLPKGKQVSPFNEKQFRDSLAGAINPTAAFQTGDAGLTSRMQGDMLRAAESYYVADAAQRGADTSNPSKADALNALEATAGAVWKGAPNGGALFAPWGMPVHQFQDQWDSRAKAALMRAGYAPKDAEQIMEGATPVNFNDGRYGFMHRGGGVITARGTKNTVIVNYGDPLPQVQPAQPPASPIAGLQNAVNIGK